MSQCFNFKTRKKAVEYAVDAVAGHWLKVAEDMLAEGKQPVALSRYMNERQERFAFLLVQEEINRSIYDEFRSRINISQLADMVVATAKQRLGKGTCYPLVAAYDFSSQLSTAENDKERCL